MALLMLPCTTKASLALGASSAVCSLLIVPSWEKSEASSD
jgi:hypothetical protein